MNKNSAYPLKGFFDIFISLILIIILTPFLLIISILVLFSNGKPIIYKQKRPGLNGKIFTIYKFRTMRDAYSKKGKLLSDSERVTRLGKFLRYLSVDELPELFNVLKGDMSLVGPRPLLPDYLKLYTPKQLKRHDVKPGITGLAQVQGRNKISWDKRLRLDCEYVENVSFLLDLKILFRTIFKLIKPEGINASDKITMEKFTGTKD